MSFNNSDKWTQPTHKSHSTRADFLPGQFFDIRLEVHSPVNGSEARVSVPDSDFKFTITKKGSHSISAAKYFKIKEPELERWNFTWYEGMYPLHSWLNYQKTNVHPV